MALDKVLPGRDFLQFLQIPAPTLNEVSLEVEPPSVCEYTHIHTLKVIMRMHTLVLQCLL